MKTDSVYVILWYKGKKVRPLLLESEAYEKKSDAKQKLKNFLKEKHKEEEKSDYRKDSNDAYTFIDGEKNEYYFWVEELVLK